MKANQTIPAMKDRFKKKPLTFGEFVAACYRACGKRRANGVIRLAVKSHMIEFRGHDLFVIT